MAKKIQVPVVGGIRKVVSVDSSAKAAGTTIAEVGSGTITLDQLAAAIAAKLGIKTTPNTVGGGSSGNGALIVGPGLSGGGPLVGAVPLQLVAPIPFILGDDGGGGDGDPGPPGQAGTAGPTGAGGPMGPAVFFLPDDPESALDAIPGNVGPSGGTGAAGPMGPAVFFLPDDPESALDAIPGNVGPPGAAGAAGPAAPIIWMPGDDGQDGEQGPPGVAGNSGGGGSVVQLPGTIPDLQYWLDSSQLLTSNVGYGLLVLPNLTPWMQGLTPVCTTPATAKTTATTLNGKPTIFFPSGQNYWFGYNGGTVGVDFSKGSTVFVVFNQSALQFADFISGGSGSLEVRMDNAGHLQLVKTAVVNIAIGTVAVAANTWFQGNATYNPSTGAYAFRMGRAAAGSGTNVQSITAPDISVAWNAGAGGTTLNGFLAELICYARVLSSTEITSVENYLNAKWGV